MKKLIIIAAAIVFAFTSCVTVKASSVSNSLNEEFGYTKAQWDSFMSRLILLGKVEEGPIFKRRTHYTSGYGRTKYDWLMFSISKRSNDPWAGTLVSFSKIRYKDGPPDKAGNVNKITDWRVNVAFYDVDSDGFPDRYVRTRWHVGEDGKLKINYENMREINSSDQEWELWGDIMGYLMGKEINYPPGG